MKIVTVSGHCLPESIIKKYGIKVVPFRIMIGNKTYFEGVDTIPEEFLGKLKKIKICAFSIGMINTVYQELLKEKVGTIFSIQMSSRISLAFNIAKKAKELTKANIEVIDTRQGAGGIGLIVLEVAKAIQKGENKEEILQIIKEVKERTVSLIAISDITQLYRTGKISWAKSLLGTIIKVIPIVSVRNKEGRILPVGKARNIFQANEKIIEIMKFDAKKLKAKKIKCIVYHTQNKAAINELKKNIRDSFDAEIIDGEMPSTAVVTGGGTWGISYYLMK
jgi:DegV family protein with EDD domain